MVGRMQLLLLHSRFEAEERKHSLPGKPMRMPECGSPLTSVVPQHISEAARVHALTIACYRWCSFVRVQFTRSSLSLCS